MNLFRIRFALKILRSPTQRKYFWRWVKSSVQKDYVLVYRQPWITFGAVDLLNIINLQNKHVFEYGSGGSTLYWLDKGASVVSIEHDPAWFNRVKGLVSTSAKLDYRLVEPEPKTSLSQGGDIANPDDFISSEYFEKNHRVSYKSYVCQIDDFDKSFFDVVLVDGRARPSCIKHSVTKIKKGGMLILDNADRLYYTKKTSSLLNDCFTKKSFFGIGPSVGFFWATNIYWRRTDY